MRAFVQLITELDATLSSNEKVARLAGYFRSADPHSAGWAIFLLSGGKLKRFVSLPQMRAAVIERAGLAEWLFEECYAAVGDLAETISLLLHTAADQPGSKSVPLHELFERRLLPSSSPLGTLFECAAGMRPAELWVLIKLVTGSFRIGVSKGLLSKGISAAYSLEPSHVADVLAGSMSTPSSLVARLLDKGASDDRPRPYPFYLASALDRPLETLGSPTEWIAEWKWDGIRAQLICGETIALWSRGEELITTAFPDVLEAAASIPSGTVIDGELLVYRAGRPGSFFELQRRLKKLTPSATLIADVPVSFMAYDLLHYEHRDRRALPLSERRAMLESMIGTGSARLQLSPIVPFQSWEEIERLRESSRGNGTEGLMIKSKAGAYLVGRKRGEWWKFKVDPFTCDAVLIYAQVGHGRRASLYTDYTFAVRKLDTLVPIAKACSGLSNEEILELDRWIRKRTREQFGPVRSVDAHQVFELAFEGVQPSPRHRSGLALRFPRILRWRKDKTIHEINSVDELRSLMASV